MTLKPEQERALSYLRRKGTEADPESVRRRVAAAFRTLEEAIDRIDADTACRHPIAGKWSVQEIVDHLVESHRPAVAQLDAVLAGRPAGDAVPAGLQSADPLSHDWAALVAGLKKVHAGFLDTLAKGTAATSLEHRAPVAVVVKVADGDGPPRPVEWIEEFDWKAFALGVGAHTREHLDQIKRTTGTLKRPFNR